MHHCNLGLANLTEFVGGCSGHSIEDTSDNVLGKFFVANNSDDSLDSKNGLCDVFAKKVGKAEILEPLLKIAMGFFVLGYHSIDHATKERDSAMTLLRKFLKIQHDFVLEGLLHQFTRELLHPLITLNVNIRAKEVKEFFPIEAVLILQILPAKNGIDKARGGLDTVDVTCAELDRNTIDGHDIIMDGMPVDLFDGGMPLRGIFCNIIKFAVSNKKNLGNIASCNGRQQGTGDNFIPFLSVVEGVSAVCLGDDDFDAPKLASSMRA